MLDEDLKEKLISLFDRMSSQTIALLAFQSQLKKVSPEPVPEWMTAMQLARYWQQRERRANDRSHYEVDQKVRE